MLFKFLTGNGIGHLQTGLILSQVGGHDWKLIVVSII